MSEDIETVLNNIGNEVYPKDALAEITISNSLKRRYLVSELQVVGDYLRTKEIGFSTVVNRITCVEISTCDADF
ncbi:MAG: hypothetical protein M0P97_04115 [Candidatus Moranbacteria bacterium]|jgi:hypothetical protein|nr:hypothetical protein [Candidatus Moranbacteria bacterium]